MNEREIEFATSLRLISISNPYFSTFDVTSFIDRFSFSQALLQNSESDQNLNVTKRWAELLSNVSKVIQRSIDSVVFVF